MSQVFIAILGIILTLILDSKPLEKFITNGQIFANIIMLFTFIKSYLNANKNLKFLMISMTLVTIPVELLSSLVLEIYSYRLHNVPLYVPIGHAVIFAIAYNSSKIINYCSKTLTTISLFTSIFAVLLCIVNQDSFGFICYCVFLILLLHPKIFITTKLFYFCMFISVTILEISGTTLGNWSWNSYIFPNFRIMPQGNPPYGIATIYFLFDIISLQFLKNTWLRSKFYRFIFKQPG